MFYENELFAKYFAFFRCVFILWLCELSQSLATCIAWLHLSLSRSVLLHKHLCCSKFYVQKSLYYLCMNCGPLCHLNSLSIFACCAIAETFVRTANSVQFIASILTFSLAVRPFVCSHPSCSRVLLSS